MKDLRSLALLLATSVLAVSASAQQTTTAQLDRQFTSPAIASVAVPSETLLPPPAAEPLVRATAPEISSEHKFFDRQQLLALYVHVGVRLADTINTCHAISHGAVEDWIPTQSCAGIVGWQAGSVGLTLGVGWMFHKHGHHTLERITPWVGTGASAAGLTKSIFNIH
jgi:hypothetical protein